MKRKNPSIESYLPSSKSSRGSGEAKRSRSTQSVSTTNQSKMGSHSNGRTESGSNSNSTVDLIRNNANVMLSTIGRFTQSTLTEADIDWLEEYLKKLESQDVTPEVLQQTSIGKLVGVFENDQKLGPKVTKLIEKWGLIAHTSSDKASTSEVSSLTKANLISNDNDSRLDGMLVKLDTKMNQLATNMNTKMNQLATNMNQLATKMNQLATNMKKLDTNVKLMLDVTMPQLDRFFDKLHVTQSPEIGSSTMSFMKMKYHNGTEKCVIVTSAHLLSKHRKADNESELFVPLPQCHKDIEVEEVLLHPRILDDQPNENIAHVDLMLVVLRALPQINGQTIQMSDLETYPRDSVQYNPAWETMNISGRSRRDFVTGRGLIKIEKESGIHYEFIPKSGEKGDSGTLLYAIDEKAQKHFVGIYKGTKAGSCPRGWITPALGWKHLEVRHVKLNNDNKKIKVAAEQKANGTEAPTMEEVTLSYTPNNANRTCVVTSGRKEIFGTIIEVPSTMNSTFTDRDNSYYSEADHYDDFYCDESFDDSDEEFK